MQCNARAQFFPISRDGTIYRNWTGEEWVIYPVVWCDASLEKNFRKGSNIQTQRIWMSRRREMQNWRDKHAPVLFLERKWYPTIIQNPFPRGPNGVQNRAWRPPGRLVSAWNAALILDYRYLYVYIYIYTHRISRVLRACAWFSWRINCNLLSRWWNCQEKTSGSLEAWRH